MKEGGSERVMIRLLIINLSVSGVFLSQDFQFLLSWQVDFNNIDGNN